MDPEVLTSLTLPATLTPISGNTLGSQRIPSPPPTTWGKLVATTTYLKSVDLAEPNFLLGRAEGCDVILSSANFPPTCLRTVSKKHFMITYDETKDIAQLRDLSKNGTYVNKRNIGHGKTTILQNYDEIAVGAIGQRVYVYSPLTELYLPPELSSKYVTSRSLGQGSYGEVKLIFEKHTGQEYAVKKIVKATQMDERIQNEIEILKSLSHPHLISTNEIAETDEAVFIILEYMRGGDLSDRITSSIHPLPENEVKLIFYQIALGVQYLHSQDITHRDLKPGNILLKTKEKQTLVKISDFGLSKIIHTATEMLTVCGTPSYVAPEIIDPQCKKYTQVVDVWSLGVILFNMLSGDLPFLASYDRVLYALIQSGTYTMDENNWKLVSNNARDLVKKMLIRNPCKRITIDGVLNHPWIAEDQDVQRKARELMSEDEDTDYTTNNEAENTDYTANNGAKRPRLK